jgi:chromosome segregation ATPase
MMTGKETLQKINSHVLKVQAQIEEADREADALTERLNRLRLEEAEQYRRLAEFRLDQIRAGTMTERLNEAHRAAAAFMEQHKQSLSALEKDIVDIEQKLKILEHQREARRGERDEAEDALELQIERSKAALDQTEEYRSRQEAVAAAAEVARRADEKASRSKADLERKGKPYQDDALFLYLWQRRYLTPDYRRRGIIRMLDDWVAKLIDFRKARADYHMLNELPRRLRQHADRTAQEAGNHRQLLLEMERHAAEKDGVPALQAALDEAEKQLQKANDAIEAAEKQYQERLREKNGYAAGEDENTQKAISLITAELSHEDVVALFQQARSTPRPEDDDIVARLQQLQQEQKTINDRLIQLKTLQQQNRKALEGLALLQDKFRRSNYDAPYSSFPGNLGLGILLGEILRGGWSSGSAWERIDQSQRWDFPKSGGHKGGGFGGFGGFRSGGGFGGRGFRTGGRF